MFATLVTLIAGLLLGGSAHGASPTANTNTQQSRVTKSFDSEWRFLKGDAPGAEQPAFDDHGWRTLNLPHDWSIEGPFDEKNSTGGAGGFLPAGVGWYRKNFKLPGDYSRRRVFIEFDGVMANSDVWINGTHLGKRPFGYVSFSYDLTAALNFGDKPNVLAVRADNSSQPASRWYTGAGIYRHVRLVVTDPVHIEQWGTFVTTPQVSKARATVLIRSTVVNQSDSPRKVALGITLVSPDGRTLQKVGTAPQIVAAGKSIDLSKEIVVSTPERWSLDDPVRYRVLTELVSGKTVLDDEEIEFGIREFHFDAATGFWLNGRNIKLKGVCLHHDASAFGAAVPDRAWERRFEILKQLGVNAIRTAHNPPSPDFLKLCDRMGLVVMDEMFDCWTLAKNPGDYHTFFNEWSKIDARDTVRRDRNHPSVILYSAGNEIRDTPKEDLAKKILKGLVEVLHEADPTRPVTQALFRPNVSHDYDNGLADLLDVIGTNYRDLELLAAHKANPARKIVGTEQGHDRPIWLAARDNPQHSGQFIWSGIDYLGESRQWPMISSNFGLLDRTGTPRPLAYERQSWWSGKPMVYITRRVAPTPIAVGDPGYEVVPNLRPQVLFSDWTPRKLDSHEEQVEIYSNCEQVELFLNGKSLGAKPLPGDASPRTWKVTFETGTLKAVGINKGKIAAVHEVKTAGRPRRILLSPDRTQLHPWDDLSYVTATVVDEKGILVPGAGDLIRFKVTGAGVIAAVDSGDNTSREPFQSTQRRAFQGRCFAIVRGSGFGRKITLTAEAADLASASIDLEFSPK